MDIDGLEEQPWRHPGVDVADYFNYGFTEDSWRVYCEKQLRYVARYLLLSSLLSPSHADSQTTDHLLDVFVVRNDHQIP